jgi:signal transduction histidine kinase
MTAVALCGWSLAAVASVCALALRRRLELAVRAEHELRGPLTALTLGVEALRREPAARARADALEVELARIRLALADLRAAPSARRAPPRPGRLELDRLLRAATAGWDPVARRAGRAVRLDLRGPQGVVLADRARLCQALSNLLANAIEHGAGRVELRAERGPGAVRLEVRDEGPGPGDGRGRRRRRNGRGRGLAIARAAVEDAGGRMSVLPAEDGSSVAIDLPGEPDPAA